MTMVAAEAMPRYQRSKPLPKCERVLVSEDLQAKVADIALVVAEWTGKANNLNLLSVQATVAGLAQMVAETREGFTLSAEYTEARLHILEAAFEQNRETIEQAIYAAKFPQRSHLSAARPDTPTAPIYPDDLKMLGQWPPNSNDRP